MDRVIKFRAFVHGKMFYWGIGVDNAEFTSPPSGGGVSARTVPQMQFTGLHDKNGKEIYEGDIVRCFLDGFDEVSEVFFDEGAFSIYAKNNSPDYKPCLFEVCETEVIGNIFENPELLEAKP